MAARSGPFIVPNPYRGLDRARLVGEPTRRDFAPQVKASTQSTPARPIIAQRGFRVYVKRTSFRGT